MEVFKKLVLFTAATIAIVFLIIWSLDAFGFRSPISAYLVNWVAGNDISDKNSYGKGKGGLIPQ